MERFQWEAEHYDCILGFVCLGYVMTDEVLDQLAKIKKAIKKDGIVIFVEAVVKPREKKERYH